MKRKLFYLTLLLIFSSCAGKLSKEQNAQLLQQFEVSNYFKLDNLMSKIDFDKNNPDLLLYKATLENVFNNPGVSNQLINLVLKKFPKHFNDTIMSDLYQTMLVNSMRLQDYESAYKAGNIVLDKYNHVFDSADIADLKNSLIICKSLVGVPKMLIIRNSDTKLPMKRNIFNHMTIPTVLNNDTVDFVLDTGADFTVISKSQAEKHGVKSLGKALVGSITGEKVEMELGLIKLKLGSIEINNAICLILPDSDLCFDDYIINGIIGMPIMQALQEFIIEENQYLIIPKFVDNLGDRNLALDGFKPVISVYYNNDTFPFHFDTGARRTMLYSAFYNKYKSEIVNQYKETVFKVAGAGGIVETEGYVLDSILLTVSNSQAIIDSIKLQTNDLDGNEVEYIYGNFGQDYIKQFSEMKINFASMNVSFKGIKK